MSSDVIVVPPFQLIGRAQRSVIDYKKRFFLPLFWVDTMLARGLIDDVDSVLFYQEYKGAEFST